MFDMFWFYMGGRWARPLFGTNGAAANAWLMLVLAFAALVSLAVALLAHRSIATIMVLVAALTIFIALFCIVMPKALRFYEVDRIVRRQDEVRRAKAEAWMHRGESQ